MPLFFPPTVTDAPRVQKLTPRHPDRLLLRHYRPLPRGRSVVKVAGTYTTMDSPEQSLLDPLVQGVDYFLGGHEYQVSDAVATALTADGYGAYLDTTQWSEISGDTWGSLAGLRWNEV